MQLYTVRTPPTIEAVYWQGDAADLQGFTKPFPPHKIDSRGTISFTQDDGLIHSAIKSISYLCCGVTGYFFVVDVLEFVNTYVAISDAQNVS